MVQSEVLVVSTAAREMAHELQSGAGTWLRAPFWYRALTAHMLPPRLRDEFQLSYGDREQRSTAARTGLASADLPSASLPAVRFVGPYLEAQAKLQGKSPLWHGRASEQ